MYHYVYYSYEEWGRGYIGVRSCRCKPDEDVKYFGSFKDKTFKPKEKIIIETFFSRSEALLAEIKLHDFFDVGTNPSFANKCKQVNTGFCTAGVTLSKEHCKKIGDGNRGKFVSEKTREKISKIHKGKQISEEHRKKVSEARKNKKLSEEHRKKLSESLRGRVHTEETREKIRQAHKGKPKSREHRRKCKEANQRRAIPIKLQNIVTGEIFNFNSQLEASKVLKLNRRGLSNLSKQLRQRVGNYILAPEHKQIPH
jgi:hypothetical protein